MSQPALDLQRMNPIESGFGIEISGQGLTGEQIPEFLKFGYDNLRSAASIGTITFVGKLGSRSLAPAVSIGGLANPLVAPAVATGVGLAGIGIYETTFNASSAAAATASCPNEDAYKAGDPFLTYDPTQENGMNTLTVYKGLLGNGATNYVCTASAAPSYGSNDFHNQGLANFVLQNNSDSDNPATINIKTTPGIKIEDVQAGLANQAVCTPYADVNGQGSRCEITALSPKTAIPLWVTFSSDKSSKGQFIAASVEKENEPALESKIDFDVVQSDPVTNNPPSTGDKPGTNTPKPPVFSVKMSKPKRAIAIEKRSFIPGTKCYTTVVSVKSLQRDSDKSKNVQIFSHSISLSSSKIANVTKKVKSFTAKGVAFRAGACISPRAGGSKPMVLLTMKSKIGDRVVPVESMRWTLRPISKRQPKNLRFTKIWDRAF